MNTMSYNQTVQIQPFSSYISEIKSAFKPVFDERNSTEKTIKHRGFTESEFREIMRLRPLSVAIPQEYGGRGLKVKECLSLLEAASYESLSLSLVFGINFALYLEPFAKYGDNSLKPDVYDKFLEGQGMGGLMISEPGYGSDALSMQTSHSLQNKSYHLEGTKHWQGLTGMANYWLIAARKRNTDGSLGRDIDLFHCDVSVEEQKIEVLEYYNNNGLYPIPYGKNKIDLHVPQSHKLIPETSGIKMLMDTLHRSRMQFPGMAMGFLKRILEEATNYCRLRTVRGNSLNALDNVQFNLSKLQSAVTICSSMCLRSSQTSGVDQDLSNFGIEANAIKAYITDLMQDSAQILTQLNGSRGYLTENLGSRGIMDSRPFQIFEGPNGMLYAQIAEQIVKMMHRTKQTNLYEYLKSHDLSADIVDRFKKVINFNIEKSMPQRKHVCLGKVLSMIFAGNFVHKLGLQGFNKELIENTFDYLLNQVSIQMHSYSQANQLSHTDDFLSNSDWLNFA